MNLSVIDNSVTTMSSVEIAELTGKEHKNVLADIRKMLVEIQSAEKPADYKDGRGRTQPCLLLTKDETLCLVAGYSAILRMAIIKRWQELEAKQGPHVPQTYAAALLEAGRLALELEEKKQQLAIQAPKVAFADQVAGDDKGVAIGNYARAVGIGQNTLFRLLRDQRVLMTGGGRHNLPFQELIDRGYFTVKEGVRTHNDETIPTFTPLLTGKGQQWLTMRLINAGYLKPTAA